MRFGGGIGNESLPESLCQKTCRCRLRQYDVNQIITAMPELRFSLVFIGAGIDWPALKAKLDAALLPEDFNPEAVELNDPFPIWRKQDIG